MIIGINKESFPGENRVSLTPLHVGKLINLGCHVLVEKDAGIKAGFFNSDYENNGAKTVSSKEELYEKSDIITQVRGLGANLDKYMEELSLIKKDQIIIGFFEPLYAPEAIQKTATKGAIAFSMELIPRITRAQSMDALSSMATISGYKAVIIAADFSNRIFPMLMTAAGTLFPSKVFIIGCGVAGLQAIATSKRLGAVVQAYDVRPSVKEQVESLGAKFVELDIESDLSEDKNGYAKELGEEFYKKQRELMTNALKESNVVITTASVPGKKAPILITEDMVKEMPNGAIIVDLASEKGGNCQLTQLNKVIRKFGVTVIGPENIASQVPYHASQLYSKNIYNFVSLLIKEGKLNINTNDEIIKRTLITRNGKIVNENILNAINETIN